IVVRQRAAHARLDELRPVRTDRGVTCATADRRILVDLVEHLLAALGGLGVRRGVEIVIEGDELPILDGGAASFCDALQAIGAPVSEPPTLVVAGAGEFRHGDSVYRFAPSANVELAVAIAFRPPVGDQTARWTGDRNDFVERFATARTFGWIDELG